MYLIKDFPEYYRGYNWEKKHQKFGYPADKYPKFRWIKSLESRFHWLVQNAEQKNTASIYLIQEMIQWGGSQNGVLQKFDDGRECINLQEQIVKIISNLDETKEAIKAALEIPGMGLSYASKLLRFMRPDKYGALDSRIRSALQTEKKLPTILDSNTDSMCRGYVKFIILLDQLKSELENQGIQRPECCLSTGTGWTAAQVEMVLFRWAERRG